MSHPYTSSEVGFREFIETSFSELQTTEWEFDGTKSDVRDFANQNICDEGVRVKRVDDIGSGTFDVLLSNRRSYRVYTKTDDE